MREEVSQHTFLFADPVGYTALTDAHGDDRAAAVALEFQRQAGELAASHRAELVKALGDAVMLRCPDARAAIDLGIGLVGGHQDRGELPPVRVTEPVPARLAAIRERRRWPWCPRSRSLLQVGAA